MCKDRERTEVCNLQVDGDGRSKEFRLAGQEGCCPGVSSHKSASGVWILTRQQ